MKKNKAKKAIEVKKAADKAKESPTVETPTAKAPVKQPKLESDKTIKVGKWSFPNTDQGHADARAYAPKLYEEKYG